MFNLIEILTDKDKELITTYLTHYSQAGKYYCGNDIFLREWAKNKKGLYKLLDGQLRKVIHFSSEKNQDIISNEIRNFLKKNTFFKDTLWSIFDEYQKSDAQIIIGRDIVSYGKIFSVIAGNKPFDINIKYKAPNAKKMLQINKGCAPVKGLGKIIKYIYENFDNIKKTYPNLLEDYEYFRQKHSLILNDKKLEGNLVLSIHPLDFLTMSNNSLGWQSCMKWEKIAKREHSGCYHAGTIEMMNSNNVICCYLEGKIPYEFHQNSETGEVFLWNNKRWRSLFIVTPEIICSGKAYPYQNKEMTYAILDELKDLAKKNKKWTYTFGIEEYQDMKNIYYMNDMERVRYWMRSKRGSKHSIVFDTSGMYNDYLNDSNTSYYCYRNDVKKEIMIRYSGKALCTCCGDQYIYNEDSTTEQYEEYNERFGELPELDICNDCYDNIPRCDICGDVINTPDTEFVRYFDGSNICYNCFKNEYAKCQDCGSIYNMTSNTHDNRDYLYIIKNKDEVLKNEYNSWGLGPYFNKYVACPECTTKVINNNTYGVVKPLKINYGGTNKYYYLPYTENEVIKEHNKIIEPTLEEFINMSTKIEE